MLDFLRGDRPWGKFWRLLDRLGENSYYRHAQQNDPEVARYIAELEAAEAEEAEKAGRPLPKKTWRPGPDDWSLLHELLAQNRDALGQMATILADMPVAPGVKTRTKPPAPYPRPETALDAERRRLAEAKEQAEVDRLMVVTARAKQRWRDQQTAQR